MSRYTERLTAMVDATRLTFDQRAEAEEVLEWLTEDPETVARYVVILEAWISEVSDE